MKRILSLMLVAVMFSSVVFAQNFKQPTGNDYLSMPNVNRIQAVTSLISEAKQGGVTIKKTPVSYCKKLDTFYAKNPDMRSRDLAIVLKTLIIMEYDWTQKNVDKDQLARKYLGDKLYEQNKIRLGKN